MRTIPIFNCSVHNRDSSSIKINAAILKNNLLLYSICIFTLRLPSKNHKINSNNDIEPAFPGRMVCGRAIEKHKNQDSKKIVLLGVIVLKKFSFIMWPALMNKYIYILAIILPLNLLAGEAITEGRKIHTDRVDSICLMSDKIISASFDGLIKSTIDKRSKIIGRHSDWVRKIICNGNYVISASNDGYISVWDGSNKVSSVKAHTWWVSDIALSNNKIVSVSLDETVKVWSYPALELLYSHKIYGSNKHYSVSVNNGKAFIGSTLGGVSILDISSFKWLMQNKRIMGRYSIPLSVAKSDKAVFFASSDGFITKMSTSPPYKSRRKKISKFPIKSLAYNQGVLYASDNNGSIFKIRTKNMDFSILNHHVKSISAIAVKNTDIYAGYDNGFIQVFSKMDIEKNRN